ncbi:hypothetical protein [Mycobacterium sp. 155]|uniref:hypothetical protein n=1 Tax=Mycobacterium sp. 155 TaxID=1157943 RepID=UPI000370A6AC|nr:hypothetical protein [Mycobacterium sp. 155]
MKTVLGLALTSTDVSWVLLAGCEATDHAVLDDDAFPVDDGDELVGRAVSAARGAQAIAASSGHEVRSVGVTGEDDIVAKADKLIASLKSMGFHDVRIVPSALVRAESSAAHDAAHAVVTDTVPPGMPAAVKLCARGRIEKWWVGGASTAAVFIGVIVASVLFMVGDTERVTAPAPLTAAGSPEIVTAAIPRLTPPTVAVHARDVQPAKQVATLASRREIERPVTPWTASAEVPEKPVSAAAKPVDVLRREVIPEVPAAESPSQAMPPAAEQVMPPAAEQVMPPAAEQVMPPAAEQAMPPAAETAAGATTHAAQNLSEPALPGPADAVTPASSALETSPTPTVSQASPAAATVASATPAQAPAAQEPSVPANPFDLFAALP